jgi:lipopolysaccharide heptosyltransferase I
VNRILIIKPSALGDVATTLPLLCDLKAAMPGAEIDWLIHPGYSPLIEGHDALHEWIAFDRKNLAAWWYKPSAAKRFTGLLRTLRDRQYDVVIDAQGLLRSGFLARMTGAKRRIGFAHAREGATLAYTDKVSLPEEGKKMVAVDRMRALGMPLGTDLSRKAEFRMLVQSDARRVAAEALGGAYVAVVPGARWDTKRWPIERYAEVVRKMLDSGERVVLLGSPDEAGLCGEIASSLNPAQAANLVNFAGNTNLVTLIGLLSRARLVMGNDSGPLHVAAALGVPVIGLYGPTPPEFVGPYGQMQNVLRHEVPCHPCRRRECDHHSCMEGLKVELVWERVKVQRAYAPPLRD